MPFAIEKVPKGFVVKDINTGKKFSNGPLTKQGAMRQRIAIAISEHKKNPNKPMRYFFAD
jgi:hypothetical protein